MKKRRRRPTSAELEILRVLWRRGPSTVREVAEATGREAAYTTVLKLLQIMTAKRFVRGGEDARVRGGNIRTRHEETDRDRRAGSCVRRVYSEADRAAARRARNLSQGDRGNTQAAGQAPWRAAMSLWIHITGWTLTHFVW